MVATFIIDWPVMALIGLVFGALARESRPAGRTFYAGAIVAASFGGVALVSYVVAPDWMWMYFLDPDEVAWAVPFVLAGYLFTFVLGFAAARGLRELPRAIWGLAAGAGVLEIVSLALTWDRYRNVGTAAEWTSGDAAPLFTSSPSGDVLVISLLFPAFAVVAVLCVRAVLRDGRVA